jgi:hypothetical protein
MSQSYGDWTEEEQDAWEFVAGDEACERCQALDGSQWEERRVFRINIATAKSLRRTLTAMIPGATWMTAGTAGLPTSR